MSDWVRRNGAAIGSFTRREAWDSGHDVPHVAVVDSVVEVTQASGSGSASDAT